MQKELDRFLLVVCLVACAGLLQVSLRADDGPVSRYYYDMTELGMNQKWKHSDEVKRSFRFLAAKTTIPAGKASNQFEVLVFVGDVFDFIGDPTRPAVDGKGPYNVDAVVISTNVAAKWRVDEKGKEIRNPHIQTALLKRLSADKSSGDQGALMRIDALFNSTKSVHAATQAIATQEILNFSPKQFCFIATDTVGDGTYRDPEFLNKVLTEEKLSEGVAESLELAASMKAMSVVFPFIGSSRPDLRGDLPPGDKMYLDKVQVKNEIIKRLNISLSGMLRGIYRFYDKHGQEKISIREIGIVIHHEDVERLSSGKWGFDKNFGVPGLQRRLIDDFPKLLKAAEEGTDYISKEERERTFPPAGGK